MWDFCGIAQLDDGTTYVRKMFHPHYHDCLHNHHHDHHNHYHHDHQNQLSTQDRPEWRRHIMAWFDEVTTLRIPKEEKLLITKIFRFSDLVGSLETRTPSCSGWTLDTSLRFVIYRRILGPATSLAWNIPVFELGSVAFRQSWQCWWWCCIATSLINPTQLAWADTYMVGCGYSYYDDPKVCIGLS